jgi:hypothetical protein
MAMTIPISTNTTIAICIQIQVGDIAEDSLPGSVIATGAVGDHYHATHA